MEIGRAAARQSALSAFVALALAVLGATLPVSAAGDAEDPGRDVEASIVRIVARGCGWERFGSGVLTADGVLTNRHVVSNAVEVEVELADGTTRAAGVVRESVELDLAVLGSARTETVPWPEAGSLAEWAAGTTRVGDPVEVIGHPGGGDRVRQPGRVQAEARGQVAPDPDRLWQLDVEVAPGSSGSGVFDRDGRLVGLVYAAAIGDGGALVMRGADVRAAVGTAQLTPFVDCPA